MIDDGQGYDFYHGRRVVSYRLASGRIHLDFPAHAAISMELGQCSRVPFIRIPQPANQVLLVNVAHCESVLLAAEESDDD